ncbi:MAG: alpha/beta fold hydrolase [Planctomycetaceae bacterium]
MTGDVRLIETNGHKLAVCGPSATTGPNVAFIHGITCDVTFWDHAIPDDIKQTMRWASFSLPCHSPSEAPSDFAASDVTAEMFAKVIGDAIKEVFGGERVHLVGWSTGGFSALLVAASYPELVVSVTSISGFARGTWGSLLGVMQRTARLGPVGRFSFTVAMKSLARNRMAFALVFSAFASSSKIKSNEVFRSALANLRDGFLALDFRLIGLLFGRLRGIDATQVVQNVTAPTLVIGGIDDPIIRIEETRHVASLLTDHELVELPACGHLFYCEAADSIWPRVDEWIQGHDK